MIKLPNLFNTNKKFSNKSLEKEIIHHFKKEMKHLSLINEVLYPTSFLILLNNQNFVDFKQSFSPLFKDCILEFHKILKRKRKIRKKGYIPHAKNWKFQFLAYEDDVLFNDNGKSIDNVEVDTVKIFATLFSETEDNKVVSFSVTLTTPVSRLSDHFEINPNVFDDITYLGRETFICPIDLKLNKNTLRTSIQNNNNKAYLTIKDSTFLDGIQKITLERNTVYVCGRAGYKIDDDDSQIIRIDDRKIPNPIICIIQDNGYKITSPSPELIKINGNILGEEGQYLSNGDDIVVCDRIHLQFTQ